MTTIRRPIWLAFVLTPLLTPFAFLLLYATYFMIMGYDRPGLSWMGSLVFVYLFGVPLGYLAMGVIGWPLVAVLRKWHKLTIGYVCGGACVIGICTFLAFILALGSDVGVGPSSVLEKLVMGLVIGLVAGLIFCAIAGVPAGSKKGGPS